ncbi:MAG: protein kinase domain-containing protein [Blastocatellia bacterium]
MSCIRCSGSLPAMAVFCTGCGQPHEPDFNSLRGAVLGARYLMQQPLGEGGLSTVFAGLDLHTEQEIVIKISDPRQLVRNAVAEARRPGAPDTDLLRNYWAEMLTRMRREVVALSRIPHPNIVRFLDTDLLGDELRYIVMERLRGATLREYMQPRGRLDLREAIGIAESIAAGLATVHQHGIIHRDLNPRNIFITNEESNEWGMGNAECGMTKEKDLPSTAGFPIPHSPFPVPVVRIIDFGIARIPQPPGAPPFTQYALLGGTISYASPEQCQNQPLDHRSDIYSLGVVLYEMLTGQRPCTGMSLTEIAMRQVQFAPLSPRTLIPELPIGVERAVLRALAKDPAARQQSAAELAAELRPFHHPYAARVVIPFTADANTNDAHAHPPEQNMPAAAPLAGLAALAAINDHTINDHTDEEPAPEHFVTDTAPAITPPAPLDEPAWTFPAPRPRPLDLLPTAISRRHYAVPAIAALLLFTLAAGIYVTRQTPEMRRALDTLALLFPGATKMLSRTDTTQAGNAIPQTQAPETAGALPAGVTVEQQSISHLPAAGKQLAGLLSAATAFWNRPPATAKRATPPDPVPAVVTQPAATPPGANPQMPPLDARDLELRREHTPAADPADSRAPVRERRPDPTPTATPAPRIEPEIRRPAPAPTPQRQPETDRYPSRIPPPMRQPDPPDEEAGLRDEDPRVIRWSGEVRREREIRLELPGVPGSINIPRAYRRQVGLIEPPGPQNKWRCVILRIFGDGHTSIVVQWWPRSHNPIRPVRGFISQKVIEPVGRFSRAAGERFEH